MRLLVLGVTGMLGSKLFEVAHEQGIDVHGTARRALDPGLFARGTFAPDRIHMYDAGDGLGTVLDAVRPDAVINCMGIIKSVKVADAQMMAINGELPHRIASACTQRGIRMVQVSTDCVFSGKKGDYAEEDVPDPVDMYGKSKAAGELEENELHLTIRTSIIGPEKGTNRSLLHWFLSQQEGGEINGYTRWIWSGLTTRAISRILLDLAVGEHRKVTGLMHVAGEKMPKYDLLRLFKKYTNKDVMINAYDGEAPDRSLRHERLDALGITVPSIEEMVKEMAEKDL